MLSHLFWYAKQNITAYSGKRVVNLLIFIEVIRQRGASVVLIQYVELCPNSFVCHRCLKP